MKCIGCGITLQYENIKMPGFSPKKDAVYCQRCFRLQHYNDPVYSQRFGIPSQMVIQNILAQKGLIIWVVDCLAIEESLSQKWVKEIQNRDVILVLSKCDLLPDSIKFERLVNYVRCLITKYDLPIKHIFLNSTKINLGLNELENYCLQYPLGHHFLFIGLANAGKSSLFNRLLQVEQVTTSYYPGTTQAFITRTKNGYEWIDTPGLEVEISYLMQVKEADLHYVLVHKQIKSRNYQIYNPQSYFIAALFRMDIIPQNKASICFYLAENLLLHRTKLAHADELWQRQCGRELKPMIASKLSQKVSFIKQIDKVDVVLPGLGWFCLSGCFKKITFYLPENMVFYTRKAII